MEVKSRIIKALRGKVVPLILVVAVTMAAQALTNVRSAMGVSSVIDGTSATDLATNMSGPGITFSSEVYTGDNRAAGEFTGGVGPLRSIDIDAGIVLSSGNAKDAEGPNISDKSQQSFGTKGDSDLDGVTGQPTRDAAVLEFDFTAAGNEVELRFVFGAEEYNEDVNDKFNNEFAIWIDDIVVSYVPACDPLDPINPVRVSINTINGGKPKTCTDKKNNDKLEDGDKDANDTDCQTIAPFAGDNIVGEDDVNSCYFVNNDCDDPDGLNACSRNVEADGFTVPITLTVPLDTFITTHHIKIAIADSRNRNFSSWIFIEKDSFRTPCSESDVDAQGYPDPDGWGDPGTDFSGCAHNEHADNCPSVWNEEQLNNDEDEEIAAGDPLLGDECDPDDDNDGVLDVDDNCQFTDNPDQFDNDFDGLGDICDPDDDNDGILDVDDNCQFQFNPSQADSEVSFGSFADGVGDRCDNCVEVYNPSQIDTDGDGKGDATSEGPGCDESTVGAEEDADTSDGAPAGEVTDSDFDGVSDGQEVIDGTFPGDSDSDNDGVSDGVRADPDGDFNGGISVIAGPDNCPLDYNPDQKDADDDGKGDICDPDDDNDLIADGLDDPDGAGPIKAGPDNCPLVRNFDQANIDLLDELAAGGPILGDVCDPDADGDGVVSVAFGGLDCDDLDASIPGPIEIPGNGKDDDCNPLTPDISISVE